MITDNALAFVRAYVAASDAQLLNPDTLLRFIAEQADTIEAQAAEIEVLKAKLEPAPEPGPALKTAAFWLDLYRQTMSSEYDSIYHDWPERADRVYFTRIPLGACLDAWLANPTDMGSLDNALDFAVRWGKTVNGLASRSALDELMTAPDIARMLYEEHVTGVGRGPESDLLSMLLGVWDHWWPQGGGGVRRLFTHGVWRSIRLAAYLRPLVTDAGHLAQFDELYEWALPRIAAQYTKTAIGWRYMFDDSTSYDAYPADGFADFAHAMDDMAGADTLARFGHPFAAQWLPYLTATFQRCYRPDATINGQPMPGGRFEFCTDGTNRGNGTKEGGPRAEFDWPHVSLVNWYWAARADRGMHQALEGFVLGKGESYRAPQFARMAALAAERERGAA